LAEAVRTGGQPAVQVIRSLSEIPAHLAATAKAGDLIVMLGAGSIGAWGPKVLDALGKRT
jgi:UDP-N-acetylmuramate-alanine ligase